MENIKLTYVSAIDYAINVMLGYDFESPFTDDEVIEKLKALQLAQVKKSKSGSSKPTKRQVENAEVLQPAILTYLATVDRATATQIAQNVDVPFEVTTCRATASLKALKECGKVVNTVEKRTSYYALA